MPRVLVVSNRLPVTIHPDRAAPGDVEQSSGGLVSAMRSVVEDFDEVVWIGWPGSFVTGEAEEKRMTNRLREASTSIKLQPVWLSKQDVQGFYTGFSNSSLWPLLHWMTPFARFKKAWAASYKRVNQQFAEVVLGVCRPGDLIWVHDYHLFLLPLLLRRSNGELPDVQPSPSQSPRTGRPLLRPTDLPPPLPSNFDEPEGEEQSSARKACNVQERRPAHLPGILSDSGSRDFCRFESMEPETRGDTADVAGYPASSKNVRFQESVAAARPHEEVKDFDSARSSKVSPFRAELGATLRIAFFLHTPFPSFEIISTLPNCTEIVEGMLGADLVGFHTYNYLRHYRSCVIRMCGVNPEIDRVEHLGMRSKLGVFPIGANWQSISEAMQSDRFSEHLKMYTNQFQGKSLVLSVERLDYSKGMPEKLAAIERYLEQAEKAKQRQASQQKPQVEEQEDDQARADRLKELQERFEERKGSGTVPIKPLFKMTTSVRNWIDKVLAKGSNNEPLDHTRTIFLFIAVPSRQDVEEYKNIEEEVHRTISTINGRFSTVDHQPIVYIHRGVSIDELAALYARADCCLVTPLVDGMNLVAKEFVAAKDRSVENVVPGTIVLSEAAGAAQELFDALVVNPYDEDAVAEAIHVGLELTKGGVLEEDARWEVTGRMRKAVLLNDAQAWARTLLRELQRPFADSSGNQSVQVKRVSPLPDFTARFFFEPAGGTKAIFLDYDGRLLQGPFELGRGASATTAAAAAAAAGRPAMFDSEDITLFAALAARSDLRVFVVSGSGKECLDEHFGAYASFTLIAENGLLLRRPHGKWVPFLAQSSVEWMEKVKPIIELFTRCTPGSTFDEKATSLLWNYSECDEHYGLFKARELTHLLALSLGNLPCQALESHESCLVEVKSLQVKKGLAVRTLCLMQEQVAAEPFAEILCIGDDDADETMFLDAPGSAYTVTVGLGNTHANHRLRSAREVQRFLSLIVNQQRGSLAMGGDSMALFKSIDERTNSGGMHEEDSADGDPLDCLQEQETSDAR